ncbi:MAG: hypothetical protein WDN28_31550 [Chthoniobacter sp.]
MNVPRPDQNGQQTEDRDAEHPRHRQRPAIGGKDAEHGGDGEAGEWFPRQR